MADIKEQLVVNQTDHKNLKNTTFRKQVLNREKIIIEMFEVSPDFIAIADTNGNILYENPAIQRLLDNRDEECLSITDLHPQWANSMIFKEGIPTAFEKGYWKGETAYIKRDGMEVPVSQIIMAHQSDDGGIAYLSSISRDISERKELENTINRQALYDVVTDLPNRRFFYRELSQIIANKKSEQKAAIIFMDLDNFKAINDTFGHHIGDCLLENVAFRLKKCVRMGDFTARFSGDEFIILLSNIQTLDEIERLVSRIAEAFCEPFHLEGHNINITSSIGVSLYPDHGNDKETLIQKADEAMYQIKRKGKANYLILEGFWGDT